MTEITEMKCPPECIGQQVRLNIIELSSIQKQVKEDITAIKDTQKEILKIMFETQKTVVEISHLREKIDDINKKNKDVHQELFDIMRNKLDKEDVKFLIGVSVGIASLVVSILFFIIKYLVN